MNEKFFDLKKEKQDRMINAALKFFGKLGYRFASTDDMVKEAGISKGLLFHYFGSKLGLYRFVYDYSVRYMGMEIKNCVSFEEKNFLKVRRGMEDARLAVLKNYPYMQLFLDRAEKEDSEEALGEISEKRKEFNELCENVEANVDFGNLSSKDSRKISKMLSATGREMMQEFLAKDKFKAEDYHAAMLSYYELMESFGVPE